MSNRTQSSISVPVPTDFGPRLQNGLRFDRSIGTAWDIVHREAAEPAIPGDSPQVPVAPEPGVPPADPKDDLRSALTFKMEAS